MKLSEVKICEPIISFNSSATNQTYIIDVTESWLYPQLIKVFLQDFSAEDIRDHSKEILDQFIYELSINNVNWIVEGE
jgi:hypothetical protein